MHRRRCKYGHVTCVAPMVQIRSLELQIGIFGDSFPTSLNAMINTFYIHDQFHLLRLSSTPMNPTEALRRFPDDALPPEQEFHSREELRTAINAWAAARGYAFVIGRSRKTPSGRSVVTFNCDRGAGRTPAPKAQKERRRKTTSRRTGCRFSITAKESLCRGIWSLVHRPEAGFDQHNHEPSFSPVTHPTLRQLSRQDESMVQRLANAGVAPKEIRSYLRINSDTLATQQDIYNCIARGKRDLAQGQTQGQMRRQDPIVAQHDQISLTASQSFPSTQDAGDNTKMMPSQEELEDHCIVKSSPKGAT